MVQFVLVQVNCYLGHQLHQQKHVLLGCLHLKASMGQYEHRVMDLQQIKGKDNAKQAHKSGFTAAHK